METQGLYFNNNGELFYSKEKIFYPDGKIILVNDYINSEINGWKWFNSREEALLFFNLKEETNIF